MTAAKTKTIMIRPLLIEARKKAKLSTQELATKTGLTNSYVFYLEHNKKPGSIKIWRKIQEVLSLKDKDMWVIINTTKRVNRKGF